MIDTTHALLRHKQRRLASIVTFSICLLCSQALFGQGVSRFYDSTHKMHVSFPTTWNTTKNDWGLLFTSWGSAKWISESLRSITPTCELDFFDSLAVYGNYSLWLKSIYNYPFVNDSLKHDSLLHENRSVQEEGEVWGNQQAYHYKTMNYVYYFGSRYAIFQLKCECEYSKMDSLKKVFDHVAASVYFK